MCQLCCKFLSVMCQLFVLRARVQALCCAGLSAKPVAYILTRIQREHRLVANGG